MDDFISIQELPSGKGYADDGFLPRRGVEKPALVVELKWDQGRLSRFGIEGIRKGLRGKEGRFCWWGLVIV